MDSGGLSVECRARVEPGCPVGTTRLGDDLQIRCILFPVSHVYAHFQR